ncbi:TetR family transcriptional regulator [Aquincola sp. S2]|uniref:TetR family transcriptional regulator n=1 Tax=Pseudaquabacterium terrae TaxID=2732868 RepID=A0ABX2E9X5_9BURK|nr:TetR family transcriptional regulator [Aquabacterium terrae]
MLDPNSTFVLGAQDPEMREIERIVDDAGHPWVHAAKGRRRCSPRTAYEADAVVRVGPDRVPRPAVLAPKTPAVFVECRLQGHEPIARVDHHHPGDAGYELMPEHYLRGSSLGQVLELLEREPTATQRLLAASDHCLTAAYQGECPGVDPDELLFLRASWRALMSGRALSDVIEGILDAAKRVRAHHDSEFGEARFFDPTELPLDLAEGAAYAGLPVRYRELLPEGILKEMFKGGTPAAVIAFMDEHRHAGRAVYGNPYRGYAGSYWPGRSAPLR